jgi:hypothetical protein
MSHRPKLYCHCLYMEHFGNRNSQTNYLPLAKYSYFLVNQGTNSLYFSGLDLLPLPIGGMKIAPS